MLVVYAISLSAEIDLSFHNHLNEITVSFCSVSVIYHYISINRFHCFRGQNVNYSE